MATWHHFHHQADIGVCGCGPSLEAAFVAAAEALTAVITDAEIAPHDAVAIRCAAPDAELLLVDWLNALVFEMATRHMLFSGFELHISDDFRLQATAWGEPLDIARHQPAVEVKGATYTALKVEQGDDGSWLAQCVVDV